MEYLDNKHKKIDDSSLLQLDKLSADGEITKVPDKPKMASFRLYTRKSRVRKSVSKKEIKPAVKKRFAFGMVSLTDKMMFMDIFLLELQ